MSERRIETAVSRTAEITCGYRAASSMESNPLYRSNDWVARLLLPRKLQLLFRFPPARKLMMRIFGPSGLYEWVIARTRYIDEVFARAASAGFSQVLLLGAGFDSRAIRFQSEMRGLNIFELDAAATQAAKIEQYRERRIAIPDNLRFVAINFEKESIAQKLQEAGFSKGAKTLVLMEGVMQYLAPQAAYATLGAITDHVGRGSWLVFDYAHASAVRSEAHGKGETQVTRKLAEYGESWQFGLDEHEVGPLLARFDFRILDLKNPRDLEETYFKDARGRIVGHVSGAQSIVTAERC
jgi:methyltransferase (TIGR00027 family)